MNAPFLLNEVMPATVNRNMDNDTVKNLWRSFGLYGSELALETNEDYVFQIGNTVRPSLPAGKEYSLRVDEKGIAIVGRDYASLMRGFMSLLLKMEYDYDQERMIIQAVTEESEYIIGNRMVHICVFPENDLYFIRRLIRLIGLCQYTHIVIEFWGMLQYDCLKELAWLQAFTKEQAAELIQECRELGMEPIPMFNQLGHAAGARMIYGKHVVLDQNPRLQRLFSPDGWVWNIKSKEVFALLKKIRNELYEVFGEGDYIHIGCDEADYITRSETERKALPTFLADLTAEIEAEGRKPMIWMDMLLEAGAFEDCFSSGKKEEVAHLRDSVAPSTVFIDWQYGCSAVPIPSLVSLKDSGHDVIGAPWFNENNYTAHIQTVAQNGMGGIMLTTWQTLKDNIPSILGCAKKCGAKSFVWGASSGLYEETATILRRVSFENHSYADNGWAKKQVEV